MSLDALLASELGIGTGILEDFERLAGTSIGIAGLAQANCGGLMGSQSSTGAGGGDVDLHLDFQTASTSTPLPCWMVRLCLLGAAFAGQNREKAGREVIDSG